MLAPFDDPEWQIWVLGNQTHQYPRFDRIFEMHDDLSFAHADYPSNLARQGVPVVVGEGFPLQADNVEVFPFAAAIETFGGPYLTSSAAYMAAYAILNGATHIGVWGVDMSIADCEYFHQRPCFEAWLGYAKGRGIEVTVHEHSPVLRNRYLYGRGSHKAAKPFTNAEFAARAKLHADKMTEITTQIAMLEKLRETHHGAKQAYERMAEVARAVESGQVVESLAHAVVLT